MRAAISRLWSRIKGLPTLTARLARVRAANAEIEAIRLDRNRKPYDVRKAIEIAGRSGVYRSTRWGQMKTYRTKDFS